MKLVLTILACLVYVTRAQFGGLGNLGGGLLGGGGGGKPGVNTPLGRVPTPVNVPGLDNLEKLFTQDWLDFGSKFQKNYSPLEAPLRKANFLQNFDSITKLAKEGALNFVLKVNEFADMLFEEFNNLFNGFNRNGQLQRHLKSSKAEPFVAPVGATIPESVDWRTKGAVTPVKNQKQCAGCWAFAAAGAIEGQIARKSGALKEVSIQHLIDCATGKYDNDGCNGGLTETGFDYVEDNGINGYSNYPYEANNSACRANDKDIVIKTKGYVRLPEGDEKALEEAVAVTGPVAAAIHVTKNLQFYGGGIFDDPLCGNKVDDLNHAILIVGYGQEEGKKYWLVKNSYGDTWGVDGYIKIPKDAGNKCGIATYARYPTIP